MSLKYGQLTVRINFHNFIAKIINYLLRAILFDSLQTSLTEEIPDFYKNIFENKPINYYKSVLRTSVKFFLVFNHFIASTGKNYNEAYSVYILAQNTVFQRAKKGDRSRFVAYQTANVAPNDMTMATFYKRLIPEKLKGGTIIKVVVPKK